MKKKDLITIRRETFLNLIAAAELARVYIKNRAPDEPLPNNALAALHNALANAVSEKPF